jgi:hypothetical protein
VNHGVIWTLGWQDLMVTSDLCTLVLVDIVKFKFSLLLVVKMKILAGPTTCTYVRLKIRCIMNSISCLRGRNGISQRYTYLQWHFSNVESCNGVSQFHGNCNGVYPINPILI